jgi:uncharacterized protein YkwD
MSIRSTVFVVLASCGQMYQRPPPTEPLPDSEKPAQPLPASAAPAPVPARTAAEAPTPAAPAAAAPSGGIAQRFVDAHNKVRAKHCAPKLTWSKKLADIAQSWANQLRDKGCVFGHSPGAKYGENLAAGTQGALDPESTVGMWYDEIKLYRFPDGGFSMQTGHFTQLVWKSTQQVGCAHTTCKGNDIYVCNYDPAGNWEGQYRREVLPLGCR